MKINIKYINITLLGFFDALGGAVKLLAMSLIFHIKLDVY